MSIPGNSSTGGELCDALGLADIIRERRSEVLEAYVQRLTQARSPLMRKEATRDQCVQHAREILVDVEASLRAGDLRIADSPNGLARTIGAARAAEGIPPIESLRAAAELFDVSMTTLRPAMGAAPDATVAFAIALNSIIGRRLQEGAAAYGDFMLERVCGAHAEERRRIARDIHDRVAQNVVAAERSLEMYLLSDPPRDDERIARARAALSQTVTSIRQVTADLRFVRPVEGMELALKSYLDALAPEGVEQRVSINGDDGRLAVSVRDQLYLVLCEAIRNAVGHAQATKLHVTIDISSHDLRATVDDDGIGLDPDNAVTRPGSGLVSMRERAELLGGSLSVASKLGCGTRIELLIPLEQKAYG